MSKPVAAVKRACARSFPEKGAVCSRKACQSPGTVGQGRLSPNCCRCGSRRPSVRPPPPRPRTIRTRCPEARRQRSLPRPYPRETLGRRREPALGERVAPAALHVRALRRVV